MSKDYFMKKSKDLKILTSYDPSEIAKAEIDYRLENWQEAGYDEKPERDVVAHQVFEDCDLYAFAWDDMIDVLTSHIQERNPSGSWRAEVVGFGWQKLSGWKFFEATNGKKFLQEILPNTDNTFMIYADGKTAFAINNFHHDAPTGEWYYVRPATKKEISNEDFNRSR
jgi:hypothetical protein